MAPLPIKNFNALHSLRSKIKTQENLLLTDIQPQLDVNIFRKNIHDVTPLLVSNKFLHSLPMPVIHKHTINEEESPVELKSQKYGTKLESSFTRNGIGNNVIRKLKRGHWKAHAIDLHGLKCEEAHKILVEFMYKAKEYRWHCICIIHGKGIGSVNKESVLRPMVYNWLMKKEDVLAFCHPNDTKGGSGALLVLLKKPEDLRTL